MSFPFVFESNFESGDNTEWTAETDTESQLDFPHHSELARFPWPTTAPFRGAYCMRVTLSGGTADANVDANALDIAANTTSFFKFSLWISPTFTGTADDTINLFELQNASNVAEATFGLRIVAATNTINFGIGETAPTSFGTAAIERGKWHTIELQVHLDDGGSNDGTIDLYVTPEETVAATVVHATQVATLDQAAVTHGHLGVQDHLATTTGVLLFDEFVQDDTRLYAVIDRFKETILLTKSGHAFVGHGEIDNISLLSGAGTDNVLSVFDTSTANTLDANNVPIELKNTANNEIVDPAGTPVEIIRGAYIRLAGTNPRAIVKMFNVESLGSSSAMRRTGRRTR